MTAASGRLIHTGDSALRRHVGETVPDVVGHSSSVSGNQGHNACPSVGGALTRGRGRYEAHRSIGRVHSSFRTRIPRGGAPPVTRTVVACVPGELVAMRSAVAHSAMVAGSAGQRRCVAGTGLVTARFWTRRHESPI